VMCNAEFWSQNVTFPFRRHPHVHWHSALHTNPQSAHDTMMQSFAVCFRPMCEQRAHSNRFASSSSFSSPPPPTLKTTTTIQTTRNGRRKKQTRERTLLMNSLGTSSEDIKETHRRRETGGGKNKREREHF